MQYRNILVRATNWVGDAVMTIPALQQLRAQHPEARISVLSKPWVGALYAREPFCDELLPYEGNRWQTVRLLRAKKFDCAILLPNSFDAALLAWLARIPVRIGYGRDGRGLLLTKAVEMPLKEELPKHQRFYYLELLKRGGVINGYSLCAPIRLAGARAAHAVGAERLATLLQTASVIGVSPGAAYGGAKRWLPERFSAAAVEIARETNSAVVVLGSQSEAEICLSVSAAIKSAGVECANLAGKTRLEALIEIAAACRLILTNDSGIMHIASALGVPTVAVFGATDHEATGPTGQYRIVREPVECSPCLKRECPIDHRCMTRVDAGRVARTALEILHAG